MTDLKPENASKKTPIINLHPEIALELGLLRAFSDFRVKYNA
jgi:hypothetical protein